MQYATSVGVSAAAPYLLLPLVLAGVAWVVWPTLRRVGAADVPGYLGIRFDPLFAMYATGVSVLVLLIGTMALLVSGATWLTPAMNWTPASSVSLLVCLGTLLAMLSPTQVTLANLALVLASGLLIAGTLLGSLALSMAGGATSLEYTMQTSQHAVKLGMDTTFLDIGQPPASHVAVAARPWAVDVSWPALLFGVPLALLWLLVGNPATAQAVAAARSSPARTATLVACGAPLLFVFTAFAGTVARLRLGRTLGCGEAGRPCSFQQATTAAMSMLVLPSGFRGLLTASLLAALVVRVAVTLRGAGQLLLRQVLVPCMPGTFPLQAHIAGQTGGGDGGEGLTKGPILTARNRLVWAAVILPLGLLSLAWLGQVTPAGGSAPQLTTVFDSAFTFGTPLVVAAVSGMLMPSLTTAGAVAGVVVAHLIALCRLVTVPVVAPILAQAASAPAAGHLDALNGWQWTFGVSSVFTYLAVQSTVQVLVTALAAAVAACASSAAPPKGLALPTLRFMVWRAPQAWQGHLDEALAEELSAADTRRALSAGGRGGVAASSASTRAAPGGAWAGGGGATYAAVAARGLDEEDEEDVVLDLELEGAGSAAASSQGMASSPSAEEAEDAALVGGGAEAADVSFEGQQQPSPSGAVDTVAAAKASEAMAWQVAHGVAIVASLGLLLAFW